MADKHQRGLDIMAPTVPIHDEADLRRRGAEPVEEPVLADAEEEEIAMLWAADPGNQGA